MKKLHLSRIIVLAACAICASANVVAADLINRSMVCDSVPESPVTFAEVMPTYPGGEQAMLQDIFDHIDYPEREKEMGIEGTVIVSFIVEKDGSVSEVVAVRTVPGGEGLTGEAVKAVKALKNFTPARINGKPVRIKMNLPVRFTLKGSDTSDDPSGGEGDNGSVLPPARTAELFFPGGKNMFDVYVTRHLQFPAKARRVSFARVGVLFLIDKNGKAQNVVATMIDFEGPEKHKALFEEEAMRLIREMTWKDPATVGNYSSRILSAEFLFRPGPKK